MALTQAQKTLIAKAQSAGGGELGTGLSDSSCAYLVARIIQDLNLKEKFPDINFDIPEFFDESDPRKLEVNDLNFTSTIEKLINIIPDADTYFSCLATLQKSRLKYARILEFQSIPTMDQVGPRALLQFGQMKPKTLAGFLLWRKWIYDIDNRAGQETGYLFEPIIANAIGGTPVSAKKSPIKRTSDRQKGRQVDCIMTGLAYEFKIRVTIAASGQGRWQEELGFPIDCKNSDYKPMLVVLDPTPNPKLDELVSAYKFQGGETYVGEKAWSHLEQAAGATMSTFIEKYVKIPVQQVIDSSPDFLPDVTFKMNENEFLISIEGDSVKYIRTPQE